MNGTLARFVTNKPNNCSIRAKVANVLLARIVAQYGQNLSVFGAAWRCPGSRREMKRHRWSGLLDFISRTKYVYLCELVMLLMIKSL